MSDPTKYQIEYVGGDKTELLYPLENGQSEFVRGVTYDVTYADVVRLLKNNSGEFKLVGAPVVADQPVTAPEPTVVSQIPTTVNKPVVLDNKENTE
jgi:hypothetical protein